MAITVLPAIRLFKLSTAHTHYSFRVNDLDEVEHISYGPEVDDVASLVQVENPGRLVAFAPQPEECDNDSISSKDILSQEFSGFNTGDYRVPALIVQAADGTRATDPRFVSYRIYAGTPLLSELPCAYAGKCEGVETLELKLQDSVTGVSSYLSYTVFPECDVIVRGVRIVNEGASTVDLSRVMSLQLDLRSGSYDMVRLAGAWARERHMERSAVHHGVQSISSTRGMSSHMMNPAFALTDRHATEDSGDAYGFILAYSGNFLGEVELDQMESTRVVLGINPALFSWKLESGEAFEAPQAFMTYSREGLGGMSRQFHDFFRQHWLPERWALAERPILINNWEATYFDFTTEKLLNIARTAAALGVEMLVLDDGWFGKRPDDFSGLGDWTVNTAKLGNMAELARGINALGMKFGLWFEPEMISQDSDLYRAHPDWAISIPGRSRSLGRHQMILDFGRPEVVDCIFRQMKKLLDEVNIEYIKWDCNRHMTENYSAVLPAERQGEAAHRFVLGTYRLYRMLLAEFPNLLIEGCSGGGGRFDAGILRYSPQIWCSDNSDAGERVDIQLGTSLFYPASTMGAHVSACPNHQTGRVTRFETRGHIAMSGTFGYELDLAKLNDEERAMVSCQTAQYHRLNPILASGDFYRLNELDDNDALDGWCVVAKDRQKGFVTIYRRNVIANFRGSRFKLKGLDEHAIYRLDDPYRSGELIVSGGALMTQGFWFELPPGDNASRLIEFSVVS